MTSQSEINEQQTQSYQRALKLYTSRFDNEAFKKAVNYDSPNPDRANALIDTALCMCGSPYHFPPYDESIDHWSDDEWLFLNKFARGLLEIQILTTNSPPKTHPLVYFYREYASAYPHELVHTEGHQYYINSYRRSEALDILNRMPGWYLYRFQASQYGSKFTFRKEEL